MYLTFQEYKDLGGSNVTEEKTFSELEPYAERHLNTVTSDYYIKNFIETDSFSYRVEKFKLAMVIQIDFLQSIGVTSLENFLNLSTSNITVGRMHIETTGINSATVGKSMVSIEAYKELATTGLLYRGVDYR